MDMLTTPQKLFKNSYFCKRLLTHGITDLIMSESCLVLTERKLKLIIFPLTLLTEISSLRDFTKNCIESQSRQ